MAVIDHQIDDLTSTLARRVGELAQALHDLEFHVRIRASLQQVAEQSQATLEPPQPGSTMR
jgi:hypothetical protein